MLNERCLQLSGDGEGEIGADISAREQVLQFEVSTLDTEYDFAFFDSSGIVSEKFRDCFSTFEMGAGLLIGFVIKLLLSFKWSAIVSKINLNCASV